MPRRSRSASNNCRPWSTSRRIAWRCASSVRTPTTARPPNYRSKGTHMREIRQPKRGFVLPYVLGFAAVLAVIAMMLLQSANSASESTYTIQDKNAVFNAAEAGLNAALDDLDVSLLTGANRTSTLPNGYKFTYTIYPNFLGSLVKLINDPITGTGQIQLPIGGAIIDSTGYDPTGQRTSTVEAAVTVDTTQLTYPHYAVAAGLDIQGSYDPLGITDSGGGNGAAVHANGNITASVGGGVQGPATASGLVNSLPPGPTGSGTGAFAGA